jgi:nucleoid DNA-binding protein
MSDKLTKAKLVATISTETGLTKQQVEGVLESLFANAQNQLGKKGPGEFTIPKLVKLKVVKKKATKARMGRNPSNGEPIKIEAKKAHKAVKATVLKAMKDGV